jgi:hypothetical protein
MIAGINDNARPLMPDDLFILNPANQPFLLGTWNLWWVARVSLGLFLAIIIPTFLVYYFLKNPLDDPNVNMFCIGLIIFAFFSNIIYAGISRYRIWIKLRRLKRDGQILIGKISNSKTQIVQTHKGIRRGRSQIRYEFKTPMGQALAAYQESSSIRNPFKKSSPSGKSVAVLYVSNDDFMAL